MMGTQANLLSIKGGPRRPGPAGVLVLRWKGGRAQPCLAESSSPALGCPEAVDPLPGAQGPRRLLASSSTRWRYLVIIARAAPEFRGWFLSWPVAQPRI